VIIYWPGETFVDAQEARVTRQHRMAPQAGAPLRIPAAQRALLEEVVQVCGDWQNTAAYSKALRDHPEAFIRMVLAETRQAANEHRIEKSRGAFFFDTLHRLAARHTTPTP
jgi:hypothetical protein